MEEIQTEYEQKVIKSKSLSYDEIVVPSIIKMMEYLKDIPIDKWPTMSNIIRGMDIYSETITTMYISEYMKGNILPLTPNAFNIMLIKHPYLINIVLQNKTEIEVNEFKSKLMKNLESSFNNMSSTAEYELYSKLLSKTKNEFKTALDYYHYMLGFKFKLEGMSIKYDTLPKSNDICYHIVHLSYGLTDTRSIVIYKSIPRLRERLVYSNNIDKLTSFIYPKIHPATKMCEIVDSNFKSITKYLDKTYVVICYDDDPILKNCTFTVAYLGEKGYLNNREIEIFDGGGYFAAVNANDISSYINLNFAIENKHDKFPSTELQLLHGNILRVIQDSLSNLPVISNVIKSIMKHPLLPKIINTKETIFFEIYLSGMKSLEGITTPAVYQSYILGYFYKDEIGTALLG